MKAVNNKKRLAFTNPTEADPFISELISGIEDGVKANLREGVGVTEIVDFRDVKNSYEDNERADVRDGTGAKTIVNLRGKTIADGTDIDQFDVENVNSIADPVDIK